MKFRFTKRVSIIAGAIWAVLILYTLVQSFFNVYVAGMAPEAMRLLLTMTAPFTVGITIVAIGTAFAVDFYKMRRNKPAVPAG